MSKSTEGAFGKPGGKLSRRLRKRIIKHHGFLANGCGRRFLPKKERMAQFIKRLAIFQPKIVRTK